MGERYWLSFPSRIGGNAPELASAPNCDIGFRHEQESLRNNLAIRKELFHFAFREQTEFIDHGIGFFTRDAPEPTPERQPMHDPLTRAFWKPVYKGREEVRLDGEFPGGGLHPHLLGNTAQLAGKLNLAFFRANMLDD